MGMKELNKNLSPSQTHLPQTRGGYHADARCCHAVAVVAREDGDVHEQQHGVLHQALTAAFAGDWETRDAASWG